MNTRILIALLITSLITFGCLNSGKKSTTTKKTTNNSNTNPLIPTPTPIPTSTITPTPTPTPTPILRVPYEASAFVAHGFPPQPIIWSTQSDGIPNSTLITDSRFHVRIKMQPSPAQNTIDKFGVKCHYVPYPYNQLRGNVRIKTSTSNVYKTKAFTTDATTGVSEVLRFSDMADFPQTSGHYVIEVIDPVESNGGCVREPGHPDVCPFWRIPHTECYSMIVQWATDYTDPF